MTESMNRRKHSFEVRTRAFVIWQKLGFNPWEKHHKEVVKSGSGDFYKGAFDGIPFLNQDAKRTFQHLLLRPGYMIRDYIRGQHERYLSPLMALIVFYAFFGLVSAVLQPVQRQDGLSDFITIDSEKDSQSADKITRNAAHILEQGYMYLHLDQHPELVDTQHEKAIAALEATLRSQGIPLFISQFFFLWLSMRMALRRYRIRWSACAAASAYVLCQFSFFMLFAVLLTLGRSTSIGILLMLFLLVVDFHQWLGIPWKQSFWRGVWTGVWYGVFAGSLYLLLYLGVFVWALIRG